MDHKISYGWNLGVCWIIRWTARLSEALCKFAGWKINWLGKLRTIGCYLLCQYYFIMSVLDNPFIVNLCLRIETEMIRVWIKQ